MSKPDHARALALFVKQRSIGEVAEALATDEAGAWRWIRNPHCAHSRAGLCTACATRSRRLARRVHAPTDDRPGHGDSPNTNDHA